MIQAIAKARTTPVIDKVHEEEFHDVWASSIAPESVLVEESWRAATCPEHLWIQEQLGDVRGLRVLDLGCGAGEAAVWFAKQGAHVVAADISTGFLDLVHRVAKLHGTQLETLSVDADALHLPPDSFDVVYAGNLLHHVGLESTLTQIHGCLKPGGRLVSWDPLCHNPVINLYRRMANQVRTPDEHPLSIRDLAVFRRFFPEVKSECFWFTTLWLFLRFYLIERVHPNQDRYWKRIVREHVRLTPRYRRLESVDKVLLGCLPFLKRFCWNIAVCATKAA